MLEIWSSESSAHYWADSGFSSDPEIAWIVLFLDGTVAVNEKDATLRVRAVRPGS